MTHSDNHRVTLRFLGGFDAVGPDGASIEISGRRSKALLAIIALSPDMSESREHLANLLWSDRGDEQARSSLRQVLASLKRDLGSLNDILDSERDRVGLQQDRVSVDAAQFQRLAMSGNAEEALEFYKGPLLEDVPVADRSFEHWLSGKRQRLSELAIETYEARTRELGGRERVSLARQLLDLDPLREASHRLLIESLAAVGERDQALRQYEACRDILERELGIEPSKLTRIQIEQLSTERDLVPDAATMALSAQAAAGGDRTTIAVLPFRNMSGDETQDFFADGIAEDLITELARYRHLTVIGDKLSSLYRDRRSDLNGMRQELGADFIIDGSVRLSGNRVRVVVKLIDIENGVHVWGDRFDREMLNIFEVQDEIVGAVIARLAFNLDAAAQKQRQRDPTSSSSAYTCFLKARAHWRSGEEGLALDCAERATRIDASYGRAHAYVGYFYAYSLFSQWTGLDEPKTIERSTKAIEEALSIDRTDPFILQRAALTYLMLGHPELAHNCAKVAAKCSACDSEILITRGLVLAFNGQHEEGVELLERALELEPQLAPGCTCALSEGRHMRRDYEGAVAVLETIVDPPYYIRLMKAVNLARLGQEDKVRQTVNDAPAGFDVRRFARSEARMCALPEDAEHWLESFRLAGIEV